jgi:hypothetical protein
MFGAILSAVTKESALLGTSCPEYGQGMVTLWVVMDISFFLP